jgi:hypothetical protein
MGLASFNLQRRREMGLAAFNLKRRLQAEAEAAKKKPIQKTKDELKAEKKDKISKPTRDPI